MNRERRRYSQRGVALVEALIAMAVMGVGLLALAGVQATLRQNADLSRQRAEAVRIAQAEIEHWRAFDSLVDPTATVKFSDLVSASEDMNILAGATGSNTLYRRTRSVTDANGTSPYNPYKVLKVDVSWTDRNGMPQGVALATLIQGVAPELAATSIILPNGNPTAQASGRNAAIPLSSVPVSSTTSAFRPPQVATGNDAAWVFNNITGLISLCTTTAASTATITAASLSCTSNDRYQLLSGNVNFSDTSVPATAAQAILPTGLAAAVQVQVQRTAPSPQLVGAGSGCFTDPPVAGISLVAYYCAVPVSSDLSQPPTWSGYAYVVAYPSGTSVCRYTRYRNDATAVPNAEHPLNYANVGGPLANQNFLVVKTVTADAADCPTGSPLPSTTTTFPQPLP